MSEFKQYRRKQIAELRPVDEADVLLYAVTEELAVTVGKKTVVVSISEADLKAGSPKVGDMIARNPKNHEDQWLVAEQYFEDNFEEL